jgi:hypothetical protein
VTKLSVIRVFAGALLSSLLLFVILSWPLARFPAAGIPSSAQNIEQPAWRYSIPGDHLQLLYHFDLMRAMWHGRIPWFSDPYEFNEGDDGARHRPGAYFFPMSAVYSVLAERLGQAAGWNLTLWISVCFSAFFSWMWLRRFSTDAVALGLGVAVILLSPFRWISLFGGSPAGIALMWVPLLAWSVDVAVRRATYASGAWLGGTLLLLFWADLQIFYLSVLVLPIFALISLLGHEPGATIPWRQWYRVFPGLLLFLFCLARFYQWKKIALAGSEMSRGRSWDEVGVFSPFPTGFLRGGPGCNDAIFVGIAASLALTYAVCRLAIPAVRRRRPGFKKGGLLLILLAALTVAGCLAVGVHGPWGGGVLKLAREHLPNYAMIRQPFKIAGVIPLWLGWLLAVGFSIRADEGRMSRRFARGVAVACLAGMAAEVLASYSATICLLEPTQAAYDRVAREAAAEGAAPGHVLVVPLWPGDSADTTVPLYFCQKYDLRTINGYSPVIGTNYFELVYRRLASVNQGVLADDQIDYLLERDIRFLLVHENLYPEKVGPFPVSELFRNLKSNPRIQFLTQAGPVHAYRLLPQAEAVPAPARPPRGFPAAFPARRWEAEKQTGAGGFVVADEAASRGAYWQAAKGDSGPVPGFATRPTRVAPLDDLCWWVRIRGAGRVTLRTRLGETVAAEQDMDFANPEWDWKVIAIPTPAVFENVQLDVSVAQGDMHVDLVLLVAGSWPREWPADGLRIPAASLFHAGYVDETNMSVVLRRDHDPDDEVVYGPGLPLPIGHYAVEIDYATSAPEGLEVARFGLRRNSAGVAQWFPLRNGSPARLTLEATDNVPVTLALNFSRTFDLRIEAVTIKRVSDSAFAQEEP